MRVPLTNHLLGVVQVPSSNGVAKRSDENLIHPPMTAVRYGIVVFRMVDVELGSRREPMKNRPIAIRRDRQLTDIFIEC